MIENRPAMLGLYRHFKGEYYFLMNVLRNAGSSGDDYVCQYFNVQHPEYGQFARPVSEWDTDVSNREDNVTGQTCRFERVTIDNSVRNLPTQVLLSELRQREDSPLFGQDLTDQSAYRDYCVGQTVVDPDTYSEGVFVLFVCEKKEDAFEYLRRHFSDRVQVFCRTFIPVEDI